MTVVELQNKRIELMRQILDADWDLLNALEATIKSISIRKEKSFPCSYNIEELSRRVNQGVKDARLGLGVSMDEVRKMSETW